MSAFIAFASVVFLVVSVKRDLPDIESLKDYHPPIPSKILARGGEVLLEIGRENREMVAIADVPEHIVNSFLAAEDDKFYQHSGVNYTGLMRAMLANLRAGKVVQGGSTITQQVAKMIFLTREKTYTRKLKDFLLALEIEKKFSKEDILYVYLNHVYLGAGHYGIKETFRGYFNKELDDVSIAESAIVAGLLVAPGRYSPYLNPAVAKKRQGYVLQRMHKIGMIDQEQYQQAIEESINLMSQNEEKKIGSYFSEWVKQKVIKEVGLEPFLTEGYIVKTSLDYQLQEIAEREVANGVRALDKRQGFHGPIGHFTEEEIIENELKHRIEILKESSNHLLLTAEGTLQFPHFLDEDQEQDFIKQRQKSYSMTQEELKKSNTLRVEGINTKDPVSSMLNRDELHKGIVLWTSNFQKMIYVSIAGVVGAIAHSDFKWAHKRHINSKKPIYTQINHPSQILKRGDQILVQIKSDRLQTMWSMIDKDARVKLKDQKEYAEHLQKNKVLPLSLEQLPEAQGSLVSIDPLSGEILAMVGGFDFETSKFNRAIQSNRQAGSAFKPIIYAAALEQGYTLSTLLDDTPQSLSGVDRFFDWKPKNYDDQFKGQMTFRQALQESRNVPTIALLQELGVDNVIDFLSRYSLSLNVPSDLSISLGSFGINPLQMCLLYSPFPSGGKKVQPISILSVLREGGEEIEFTEHSEGPELEDEQSFLIAQNLINIDEQEEQDLKNDEEIENNEETETEDKEEEIEEKRIDFSSHLEEDQILDRRLAFLINSLLKGVIQNGTGRKAASVSPFIAGKTGTTNNYVDAWFVGYSHNLVTSVWTGMDDNTTLGFGETGARAALPIWADYMKSALKIRGEQDFAMPAGVVNVRVDPITQKVASPNNPSGIREYFVDGTEPGGEFDAFQKSVGDDLTIEDDDYYFNQ